MSEFSRELDKPEPIELASEANPVISMRPSQWRKLLRGDELHHYAAACVLYRWNEHEYHYPGAPIMLTETEFRKAVEAAAAYPSAELVASAKSPLVK